MQIDELWPNGPKFIQRPPVFKLGTDSVLLAHFTDTSRAARAVDLGCGGGVLAVLLAGREPALTIDCVDILPEAVTLTAENAALNGLADRIRPHLADIRDIKPTLPAGAYDLAVSNPPYFPAGGGKRAKGDALADARDETLCTIDALCRTAAYLLRWGGRFFAVHRPERLGELFVAMHKHGIEPKRLRTAALTAAHAPNLVLAEGRRGGNPGLSIDPTLLLQTPDGSESAELKTIYRR
ncbi:MAG: methyltransferase [Oscillospiraceae bacterium]|nr:methyltransferase [Oscillospiraceae bacterium]